MKEPRCLLEQVIQGGCSVFVRTLTYHYIGRVVGFDESWVELADATWVIDSGRFHTAIAEGTLDQHEPYLPNGGRVLLNRTNIVDMCEWVHPLPREAR